MAQFTLLEEARSVPWWRMPQALWRAIGWNRRLFFAPRMYIGALAAGGLVGLMLDRRLGVSWWSAALLAPAALWLVQALPALFRNRTWAAVRMAHDPGREVERRERAIEAVLRSPPFALFGLSPRWTGLRFVGGHGTGMDDRVTSIELAHGDDPFDLGAPQVRVEIERGGEPLPVGLRLKPITSWMRHENDMPPPGLLGDGLSAWLEERERRHDAKPPPTPRAVTIPVDGDDQPFTLIAEGPRWGAVAEIERLHVQVRASNVGIEDVELVKITDALPCIEGSRRLRARPED